MPTKPCVISSRDCLCSAKYKYTGIFTKCRKNVKRNNIYFRKDGHSVSKPYMYFKSQIMVITDERQRVRGSGVCLISASKASPSVNLMASGGMVAPCVIGINGDLAYTFSYMVRWWFAYDLHIIYEVRYFYIMR